jgi:hypothetical protein
MGAAKGASHCVRGHKYTKKNTVIRKTGYRECRECCRVRGKERAARISQERALDRINRETMQRMK